MKNLLEDLCAEIEPTAPTADDRRDGLAVVFSGAAMDRWHDSTGRDDETAKRLKNTFKRLRESGASRPLRSPAENWRKRIEQLV